MKETTNKEITNKETANKETTNKETTNKETTNKETTNKKTTNEETINKETTNEETINKETTNKETTNEETTNKEKKRVQPTRPHIYKKKEHVKSDYEIVERIYPQKVKKPNGEIIYYYNKKKYRRLIKKDEPDIDLLKTELKRLCRKFVDKCNSYNTLKEIEDYIKLLNIKRKKECKKK